MKGLILAGGKGTRLRPLTFTRSKQLIPIANKANLFYVVEDIVAAGITEIGVIVSPETGDEIIAALGDGDRWGAKFEFITQDAPMGLAHAVKTARGFLADDPFVMYLGDNLLSGGITHLVEEYARGRAESIVLLNRVTNPSQFGVAVLNEAKQVVRLVEKPADPPSDLALVGVYLFGPAIHEIIDTLEPSGRGEYEITDAIQGLVDRKFEVIAHEVRGWWKDTGRPEDLLEANRLMLTGIERDIKGQLTETKISGQVIVEEGARLVNSDIRGPAHIAAGAIIENSYVGPYTSVGPGAKVIGSEVEYSILLKEAELRNLPRRLDASVIGQGVVVSSNAAGARGDVLRLVLGDYSQVEL